MTTPQELLAAGYFIIPHEASWEDIGDAENGPKMSGGPAYDEYRKGTDVYIVVDGKIADHFEDQFAACFKDTVFQ